MEDVICVRRHLKGAMEDYRNRIDAIEKMTAEVRMFLKEATPDRRPSLSFSGSRSTWTR